MALSRIATLFDPLGFWAPDIIQGKIIMQELWLQGLEQNDRLRLKFMHWCNELEQISETEVPRCLQMNLGKQEHAAVAYLEVKYENGELSRR